MDRFDRAGDGPTVIMAGVDGSPTSLRAGAYAAGLARRQGARLVFVSVAHMPMVAGIAPDAIEPTQLDLDRAIQAIRRQVEAGVAHYGVSAEFCSVHGDPYTELTRLADELQADTVVVGASMKAGHWLVGSLAVRLVRAGRWPVTVVP